MSGQTFTRPILRSNPVQVCFFSFCTGSASSFCTARVCRFCQLRPIELSSTSAASAMSTDAQSLVQLIPCMSRLPGSKPPLLELVQFHLQRYQQQWPIEINSHRFGNFSFRVMFTHMLPKQCPVFASVSRAWYRAVCYRIRNMGHVDYRAPRQLPRQFEVVDTVIFRDSESEFHGQTDSDRMSTLNFIPLFAPIRQ